MKKEYTSYYERFAGSPAEPPAPGPRVALHEFICPESGKRASVVHINVARLILGCNHCNLCDGCQEVTHD